MTKEWVPSPDGELEARRFGYEAADLAPGFRDWYLGKGEKAADWDAVFRTWIRRQADRDGKSRQGHMPTSLDGGTARQAAPEPLEAPEPSVDWLPGHPEEPALVEAWKKIHAQMRTEIGGGDYRNWLRPMVLHGLDGDELVISLPSGYVRDWVSNHYGARITTLWKSERPDVRRIEFQIREGDRKDATG